jgi:hypothetical protein
MPSLKETKTKLADFDHSARRADKPEEFAAAWKRIFHQELSDEAAKSFARYYKEMRSKSLKRHGGSRKTLRRRRQECSRQKGGMAPVNYGMVPGLLTNTYGNFPVEVDTDPASIRDLDVYFHDSLPLSPPGYWPRVPADMGSNKVGGAHRRRKTARKHRRGSKQRGGNLLDSLAMRPVPYIATPYPNYAQTLAHKMSGDPTPVPSPSSPVNHTWSLQGSVGAPINPGIVTPIGSDFTKLASPAPWQTTN